MDTAVIVEAVEQTTPIDRTLTLRIKDAVAVSAFAYAPGQFVALTDPEHDPKHRRAYSLSSSDRGDGRLRVTVRDMGDFGAHLYRLEEGARLVARTPQGKFVLDAQDPMPIVMVAGGSGVTPFHAFVEVLAAQPEAAAHTLLQSARVAEELVFRASFEAHSESTGRFTYVPTVTREPPEAPWPARRGRIDRELIAAHAVDAEAVRFYVCGPAAFVRSMLEAADALGIPKARRHREQWG